MWEIRAAAQSEAIDLYIYGDVEGDSYDWWTDEVIESENLVEIPSHNCISKNPFEKIEIRYSILENLISI